MLKVFGLTYVHWSHKEFIVCCYSLSSTIFSLSPEMGMVEDNIQTPETIIILILDQVDIVEEPGFKNVKNKHLGKPPF